MVLVLVLLAAFVAFRIYISNYYVADEGMLEAVTAEVQDRYTSFNLDSGTVYLPMREPPRAIIAFYPGGKVEADAYSGLMSLLAARGFVCILPKMPDNIALLGVNAIDSFKALNDSDQQMADSLDWYMAGHSLGGIAASRYLEEFQDKIDDTSGGETTRKFKGMIFCASYPVVDLSDNDTRLLSIYGSNDGVLNMDSYNESKSRWPADSEEVVIDGGIHSFFGCYGIQDGDGEPAISNIEQLNEMADIIDRWIGR